MKLLADRAGVDLPEIEYSDEVKKKEGKKAKLLEINKEAAKYFYYQCAADGAKGDTAICWSGSLTKRR